MWQEVKLKKQVWHIGLHQIQEPRTKAAFQGLRAATVATVERSTALAATAAGGVLPRTVLLVPGFWDLGYLNGSVGRVDGYEGSGFSVRCLRD